MNLKNQWIVMICLTISLVFLCGCGLKETGSEVMDMSNEEKDVLAAYEAIQQAMIDKDIDTLDALIKEGTIFTHMSGKQQTKEEFFGEIADGTLNYYAYELHEPIITVDGNKATITGSNTLRAKVYGASGSWRLPINAHFEKVNDSWISCNE